MEEKDVKVPVPEPDKHETVIEWETDTERVKITLRVERFPKE